MDKETLKALRGSIAKWKERATTDKYIEPTKLDCPLCVMYHPALNGNTRLDDGCGKCPVKLKTGYDYCKHTPLNDYDSASKNDLTFEARKELEFLRSLLPSEEE